jgi:hypothetical protein
VRRLTTEAAGALVPDYIKAQLLSPPQRDTRVIKEFAYRASYCGHAQMAALIDFIRTPPAAPTDPSAQVRTAGFIRPRTPDTSRTFSTS